MIVSADLMRPGSTVFAALPLFHTNALLVTVLGPLLKGQHVVWAGPLGYRDLPLYGNFWKLVERHGIMSMSGVPTVYARARAGPRRRRHLQPRAADRRRGPAPARGQRRVPGPHRRHRSARATA